MIEKPIWHCENCIACEEESSDTITYKCKFNGEVLTFDVMLKTPCTRFIPADYIASLNFDTR